MAEPVHRLTLPIPASLKPRLVEAAARERRSLTGQIIVLLERAVQPPAPAGGVATAGEPARA